MAPSSHDEEPHYISGFSLSPLLQHPYLHAFEAAKYPTESFAVGDRSKTFAFIDSY